MKYIALSLVLGLAGCGQPGADEPSNGEAPARAADGTEAETPRADALSSNPSALAEALASKRLDPDYAESRAVSEQRMAERDRAFVQKHARSEKDAAALEEVLREHREAKLRVQDLTSVLASSGLGGDELRRAVQRSPEMAKATPGALREKMEAVIGREEAVRFEAGRVEELRASRTRLAALVRGQEAVR